MQSNRNDAQPALADQRELLVNALTSVANAVFITDETGKIIWINDAFSRLSGYTMEDAYGRTPAILQSGKQSEAFYADLWQTIREGKVWHGEVIDRRKDGTLYTADEVITPLFGSNGTVTNFIAIQHDITSKHSEEELHRYLAYHDALTGLPNRTSFAAAEEEAISQARRSQEAVAVMFLDLDGFKVVNDTHGHQVGDLLLAAVADRLRAAVRREDKLARLGGDEFAILLTGISDMTVVQGLAGKLVDAISRPFMLRGRKYEIGVSIGIALYPEHGEDPELLLNLADSAMYEAKRSGGSRFRIGPDDMQRQVH
jgi:diguanylate cyclase (GGDEF)-like protein/PAS domain S-box-containing protein